MFPSSARSVLARSLRLPVQARGVSTIGKKVVNRPPSKVFYGSLALTTVAGSLLLSQAASPAHAEAAAPLIEKSGDPLSLLSPSVLANATEHFDYVQFTGLIRTWLVYAGSSQAGLVSAGPWMISQLEWTRANIPVVGEVVWSVFCFVMKGTFYDTFVGGATVPACAPIVAALGNHGVGVLFNYSAEATVDGSASATGVNRHHIEETVDAVRAAAQFTMSGAIVDNSPGALKPSLIAVKISGLVFDPSLLIRASTALVNCSSIARGTELPAGTLFPAGPDLSEDDHAQLAALYAGLQGVCDAARTGGVRLFIDAEQSWYQTAIDRYAELLSEEFNRPLTTAAVSTSPFIPIVHNTYQCYLRSAEPNMTSAHTRAHSKGYAFGAKLVRGAYVEAERKRSTELGEKECVIWSTKDQTDKCFDRCASLMEDAIAKEILEGTGGPGTGVCYATHNGGSTRKVLEALRAHGLVKDTADGGIEVDDRIRGRITFAQLLGMSDNLTYSLVRLIGPPKATATGTDALPLVVKYLPFASVDQALPYLIRRANENQSLLAADPVSGRGGAAGERKAVGREIRRRIGMSF